jgi:saccharopine dehydrogenase-like NADP-dependent oxidoreductase
MVDLALPAVVGARMCMDGKVEHGLITPDVLDPQKFFAGMEARGVPFEFDEKISHLTEEVA